MQGQLPPNRLSELRVKHDLKFHEIAALVGRGETVIRRYETGDTKVPDDVKLTLAKHYQVTVAYLMGWDEETVAA